MYPHFFLVYQVGERHQIGKEHHEQKSDTYVKWPGKFKQL